MKTKESLSNLLNWLFDDYHDPDIDEPYEGAGYCTCEICQEIAPRIMAAVARIEKLQAENARLREALRPFAELCDSDEKISLAKCTRLIVESARIYREETT